MKCKISAPPNQIYFFQNRFSKHSPCLPLVRQTDNLDRHWLILLDCCGRMLKEKRKKEKKCSESTTKAAFTLFRRKFLPLKRLHISALSAFMITSSYLQQEIKVTLSHFDHVSHTNCLSYRTINMAYGFKMID